MMESQKWGFANQAINLGMQGLQMDKFQSK